MEDLSEKEQLEQIRNWWRENGTFVIAGVVLGVGAIFGWNYWQSSQVQTRIDASTTFESLADEVAENRVAEAETIAARLHAEFPSTIYADQARLAMARLYMDQGRDQDAAAEIRSLIDSGTNIEMKMVARLRLAKILLYQGRPEEVLPLLSAHLDSGFAARYQEAIGDAHFALGNYREAEEAWLAALNAPRATQLIDVALVQMKIADLPETAAADDTTGDDTTGDDTAGDEDTAESAAVDEEPVE